MKLFLKFLPYIIISLIMLFIWSCEPKVTSILHPESSVTREGLQLELDIIEATIVARTESLKRQEHLRELIFNNALLLAEGSNLNPAAILTAFASIYGVGSAVKDSKKYLKDHKFTNSSDASKTT